MPKFNQIIKLAILILLTIASSALVVFAIKNKISEKASLVAQKRAILASMDKREDNFLNLKNNYGIVTANLPLVKIYFPTIDEVENFMDRADGLAVELGGTKTIKFDNNPELFGLNLRKLNFTIIFSGKKELFARFTQELGKLPYFTKINRIEIKNTQDSSANPDVMTINGSLFLKR